MTETATEEDVDKRPTLVAPRPVPDVAMSADIPEPEEFVRTPGDWNVA